MMTRRAGGAAGRQESRPDGFGRRSELQRRGLGIMASGGGAAQEAVRRRRDDAAWEAPRLHDRRCGGGLAEDAGHEVRGRRFRDHGPAGGRLAIAGAAAWLRNDARALIRQRHNAARRGNGRRCHRSDRRRAGARAQAPAACAGGDEGAGLAARRPADAGLATRDGTTQAGRRGRRRGADTGRTAAGAGMARRTAARAAGGAMTFGDGRDDALRVALCVSALKDRAHGVAGLRYLERSNLGLASACWPHVAELRSP